MEATMQALVRIRATGPDPATGTMSVELVDVLGEQLLELGRRAASRQTVGRRPAC